MEFLLSRNYLNSSPAYGNKSGWAKLSRITIVFGEAGYGIWESH